MEHRWRVDTSFNLTAGFATLEYTLYHTGVFAVSPSRSAFFYRSAHMFVPGGGSRFQSRSDQGTVVEKQGTNLILIPAIIVTISQHSDSII